MAEKELIDSSCQYEAIKEEIKTFTEFGCQVDTIIEARDNSIVGIKNQES